MAIQQHPIPQNVTSYQFRLVGDMTLMQFFQLAGGIVLGLVIYATGLPFFIKWPLIAVAVGLGAGMAFLPVEGRPMDKWLLAFIRSIYTPTIYTWKKVDRTPIPPTPKAPLPQAGNIVAPVAATPAASQSFNNSNFVNPVTPPAPKTTANSEQPTTQPPQQVQAVPVQKIHIAPPKAPEKQTIKPVTQPSQNINTPINPIVASAPNGQNPVFSTNLPIPSTPSTPNTIVGMTLTSDGKILDSAIIEIRHNTETVRATKSNKLGQFLFLKPLDNGTFQLTAEHPDYNFKTYAITVKGEIVRPIKLQAFEAKPKIPTPQPFVQTAPPPPTPTPPVVTPMPPVVASQPAIIQPPQTPATIINPNPPVQNPAPPTIPVVKPVTLVDNASQLPKNSPAF